MEGNTVSPGSGATHEVLLQRLLTDQHDLTAVERFALKHESETAPTQARYYRNLLPTAAPSVGQQYAFEVDLDACTACKACVAACHNLNGLDDGESWRDVGELHDRNRYDGTVQTVTTACHHCLDPACSNGCPVRAYDKDPETGIVHHLDDQCIGCKYCTLTCPYEVPKYNASLGIVRKCDMCAGRLAAGEAPACVQACPNFAIKISVVDHASTLQRAGAGAQSFLPGAPSPDITAPSTVYRSTRALPEGMLAGEDLNLVPSEAHPPLVAMLILTQLSVGLVAVERLSAWTGTPTATPATLLSAAALACALGLAASTAHLGRPLYAFRALLGLRTSWLSREILAFGVYFACVLGAAVSANGLANGLADGLADAALVAGIAALMTSVMVYHATKREMWNAARTASRFALTAGALGALAAVTIAVMQATPGTQAAPVRSLASVAAALCFAKLCCDRIQANPDADPDSVRSRSSALLGGPLRAIVYARWALGLIVVLSLAVMVEVGTNPVFAVTVFLLALAGEVLERNLFFRACTKQSMPGSGS